MSSKQIDVDGAKLDGILINDNEVISGMDREFTGSSSVIPVYRKKDGTIKDGNALLSEEDFADLVNVPHGIATAMGSYPACIFQGRDTAKVEKIIKQYGIPVKPSLNKVTEEIFVKAWQGAAATRADRYTILSETDLSDARLKEIYRQMEEKF